MSSRMWRTAILLAIAIPTAEIVFRETIAREEAVHRLQEYALSSEFLARVVDQGRLSIIFDHISAFDSTCQQCYIVLAGDDSNENIARYVVKNVCVTGDCAQLASSKWYYINIDSIRVPSLEIKKKCVEDRVFVYLARYCESSVKRGADLEIASWGLVLQSAVFDIGSRAFGEGEMKSTVGIGIDFTKGRCDNVHLLSGVELSVCRE